MNFRFIIRILSLCLLCVLIIQCKTEEILLHGELYGTVYDATTKTYTPVPEAVVKIKSFYDSDSTYTDNTGEYSFKSLNPGEYEAESYKYGYGTTSKQIFISPAVTKQESFALNPSPVPGFSENYLDFGLDTVTQQTFTISNKGFGEFNYMISFSLPWITAFPAAGTVSTETDTIKITINRENLPYQTYNERMTITTNIGKEYSENNIDILVNGVWGKNKEKYYRTAKYGTQWWINQNLSIGKPLPQSYPLERPSDNGIIEHDKLYAGPHYTWDEMMEYKPPDNKVHGTTQGICPVGWHIPTMSEWQVLIDYFGGSKVAYQNMAKWDNPTDWFFLSGPGQMRDLTVPFILIVGLTTEYMADYWSSSKNDLCNVCMYFVRVGWNPDFYGGTALIHLGTLPRSSPVDIIFNNVTCPVRCIRDVPAGQ